MAVTVSVTVPQHWHWQTVKTELVHIVSHVSHESGNEQSQRQRDVSNSSQVKFRIKLKPRLMMYVKIQHSSQVKSQLSTSRQSQQYGYRSKRRQVGSATNKTATRRNGDNLNGDNTVISATNKVKMATFASGNADIFGQIGNNFGRTITLTLTPNPNP